jgi:hypothetical protein
MIQLCKQRFEAPPPFLLRGTSSELFPAPLLLEIFVSSICGPAPQPGDVIPKVSPVSICLWKEKRPRLNLTITKRLAVWIPYCQIGTRSLLG